MSFLSSLGLEALWARCKATFALKDHTHDDLGAADYVVAQGEDGYVSWRKWNSGLAEVWMAREATVDIQTAWGAVYYDGLLGTNYPFEFAEVPDEWVTVHGGGGNCWAIANMNTATTSHDCYIVSPTKGTYTVWVEYYAVGRWQ